MAGGGFSFAVPEPSKTPLRKGQALRIEARRIRGLGPGYTPTSLHSNLPEVPSSLIPGGTTWLVGKPSALEKHVSQDRAIPSCFPNQLGLTCLPFSPLSSQPLPTMPASRAHGVTRGEKARGKGPSQMARLSTPPTHTLCSLTAAADITNQSPASLPLSGSTAWNLCPILQPSELVQQREATSHACYHRQDLKYKGRLPPLGTHLPSGTSERIRTHLEVGMTRAWGPGIVLSGTPPIEALGTRRHWRGQVALL